MRAAEFKRSCRTRMTMEAVRRYRNREFYIPWSFDYRGRAYPIPAFLTPQDTDFGKSLLQFADEAPADSVEKWLAFQVATSFGLDKATMDERLEWTRDNVSLVSAIATNPVAFLAEWEAAEEPWQFLAACEEYYHCCIARDRYTTSLPVATDATCSGLQILAGLARDKSTAKLVNVVPSSKPQDAYAKVAETALSLGIPTNLHHVWDRKCVKRTVMTIPYNAKPFSNRSYIKDALKEKGVDIHKDDLTQIVHTVRQAMHMIVPGPMSVMKWIETEVAAKLKRGAKFVEWCTPSGFVVRQRIFKKRVERLDLQLLGRCQLSVATEDSDEVDMSRHKAATAPNLIHSLDASLLHLGVRRFDHPIALIHDSVLSRACDMDELSAIIRETYMHLFAEHDYLNDFARQIQAKTEPPIIGDLQPESVIESTYFFC